MARRVVGAPISSARVSDLAELTAQLVAIESINPDVVDLALDLLEHLERFLSLLDRLAVLRLERVVAGLDAVWTVEGVVDLGVDARPCLELLG